MVSVFARLGLFSSRPLAVFGRQLLRQGQERLYSASEGAQKYTKEHFQSLIKDKPLVLFMKGEPAAPMCGFSRLVVQILHMHGQTHFHKEEITLTLPSFVELGLACKIMKGVEDYPHYNILEDMEFKEAVKVFSNWPTFPQVYMNGELVGGADIMLQLHQSGELISELERIGHQSILDKSEDTDKS